MKFNIGSINSRSSFGRSLFDVLFLSMMYFSLSSTSSAKGLIFKKDRLKDTGNTVTPLAPLNMQRVKEIADMLPEQPRGFGENYHNRREWLALKQDAPYQGIIKKADSLIKMPFPAWSDEKYLQFFFKGTRPEGEKMIIDRVSWLSPLVWAECLENKGRFMPAINMVLKELVHHKSWTLPAHDQGKQNFEGRRYSVDLYAAGLADGIAQAIYLLDDKLSPELRNDILTALETRIFNPVQTTIAKKDNNHFWLTITSNWNPVCLAGVTGAALASIADKMERAKFVAIAERYSRNGLVGFTSDGYCTEGLGYYSYGFGHYMLLREMIFQATNKTIDLFSDPKISKIAAYAPNLEIMNDVYPVIADCRVGTKAPADILWYCNRNLGLGLNKFNVPGVPPATDLVESVMIAFPNSASAKQEIKSNGSLSPGLRSYFKEAGVLIVRPVSGSKCIIGAALKGGNNNEIHNHNDVGSYSVVIGDEMLMGDPGGPFAYHANTFGPERYTYKALSSYGHPVPVAAGKLQIPGQIARAEILETSFSPNIDKFGMDISSAYGLKGLGLRRFFSYDRTGVGSLTVTDDFRFTAPEDFESTLITRAVCRQVKKDQLEFSGKRYKMLATIDAPGDFDISFEKISEDQPEFTRVLIHLKKGYANGQVRIVFKPVI